MGSQNTPWFSEEAGFFGPRYYVEHLQVHKPETTQREVGFIAEVLELAPGARILDLACGYGRHAVELARLGCSVTGLDCNGFLLEQAKRAAAEAAVAVRWVKGDMRQLPFDQEFDAVINLYNSLGFFETDAEHQRVLDEVARVLRPGGSFLVEVVSRDMTVARSRERPWQLRSDGALILSEGEFDAIRGRIHEHRIRIDKDGAREEFDLYFRMFAPSELIAFCERSGLTHDVSYGAFAREPITVKSSRHVMVARRPIGGPAAGSNRS